MYDPRVGRWLSPDPIEFEAGDMNLYRYVGNSPTNGTDPSGLAGVFRNLTEQEKGFLEFYYLAAMPGLRSENQRVRVARVLSTTKLWDANTICGAHTVHPWNLIAQSSIYYGGAIAVTLGPDQYYKILPIKNDPNDIDLIGHETFHSLHADGTGGTTAFLIGYGADSMAALRYEGSGYDKNLSEIAGHAVQDSIRDLLRKHSNLFGCFKPGNPRNLPKGIEDEIRRNFLLHLNTHLQVLP